MTRGAPSGLRKFQPTRSPPRNPKYISVESTIRSAPNRPTLTPSALIRIHGSTQAPQPHSRIHARATSDGGSAARSFPARPHAGTAAHPDRRLRRRQVQPALTLHAQRVQPRVQVHHRGRVCHQEHQGRRQGRQGPDLGHRRPGEVLNPSLSHFSFSRFIYLVSWSAMLGIIVLDLH